MVDEWVDGKRVLVTNEETFVSKKQEDFIFEYLMKIYKEGKFSKDLLVTNEGTIETKRLVVSFGEKGTNYCYGGVAEN